MFVEPHFLDTGPCLDAIVWALSTRHVRLQGALRDLKSEAEYNGFREALRRRRGLGRISLATVEQLSRHLHQIDEVPGGRLRSEFWDATHELLTHGGIDQVAPPVSSGLPRKRLDELGFCDASLISLVLAPEERERASVIVTADRTLVTRAREDGARAEDVRAWIGRVLRA